MVATLADVAARAGVSTAAASMVLSGRYKGRVSKARAAIIEKAAIDLDYVRNDLAHSLRTKKSNTIGIVTDNVASTPYAVDMIAAATSEAREHGYLLMLIETGGDDSATEEALLTFKSRNVDGIAFASMYHRKIRLPENADRQIIILDGYSADDSFTSVVPDEVQGAMDATDHLIKLGHTRIGFINDSLSKDAGPLRLQGFQQAHEENGLPFNSELVVHAPVKDRDLTFQAIVECLKKPSPPTALFCFNDETATLVYRAARHLNLEIPDDLSVVGFDNFQSLTNLLEPGLTTVQLPHAEMARWVVSRLIINQTESSDSGTGAKHLFNCPLVIRESTASPKQKNL